MKVGESLMFAKIKKRLKKSFPLLLTLVVCFFVWDFFACLIDKPILPRPIIVLRHFKVLWKSGAMLPHIFSSIYRLIISVMIALLVSLPVGLVCGRKQKVDKYFSPFLYLGYSLPKVLFLPIILIFLGLGDSSKICLLSTALFFHFSLLIRDAAKSIPNNQTQLMKSLQATPWQTFHHLLWPACLPTIVSALRTSLGMSLALLFIAETFAARSGLGYYIMNAMETRNYDTMYAAMITLGIIGMIGYLLLDLLENWACSWKITQHVDS